jgi:hypothetical protein
MPPHRLRCRPASNWRMTGSSCRCRQAEWRRFGAAHAPSPDVRYGHPALRSLDGGGALGILPSLAANAGSRDMGSPSRISRWAQQVRSCSTNYSGPSAAIATGKQGIGGSSRSFWIFRPSGECAAVGRGRRKSHCDETSAVPADRDQTGGPPAIAAGPRVSYSSQQQSTSVPPRPP